MIIVHRQSGRWRVGNWGEWDYPGHWDSDLESMEHVSQPRGQWGPDHETIEQAIQEIPGAKRTAGGAGILFTLPVIPRGKPKLPPNKDFDEWRQRQEENDNE